MAAAGSVILGLWAWSGTAVAQTVPATPTENDLAVIAAAAKGELDWVAKAMRAGGGVKARDANGRIALLEAVILGDGGARHTDIVRMLVAAKADVNLADKDGVTPLAPARRRGFAEMVKVLEAAGAK